jgi:hypothetical protein
MAPHVVFHVFSRLLKQYGRVLKAHACLLALAKRQATKMTIRTQDGDLGVPVFQSEAPVEDALLVFFSSHRGVGVWGWGLVSFSRDNLP